MKISTKSQVKSNRIAYLVAAFFIFLNLLYKVLQDRETGDIKFELGSTEVHVAGEWIEWYTPIYWPFFIIILFLIYRGPVLFAYDTEGDVMNLKVEDKVLFFMGRFANKHYEFPKRKLISWHIISLPFFKLLTIDIESKTGSIRTRRMPISYLKSSQLKGLKMSLNKAKALNAKFNKEGDSLRKKGPKKKNKKE
jgi:hypothetical protein